MRNILTNSLARTKHGHFERDPNLLHLRLGHYRAMTGELPCGGIAQSGGHALALFAIQRQGADLAIRAGAPVGREAPLAFAPRGTAESISRGQQMQRCISTPPAPAPYELSHSDFRSKLLNGNPILDG